MMESVNLRRPARPGTVENGYEAAFRATLEPSSSTRVIPPPTAPSFAGRGATGSPGP